MPVKSLQSKKAKAKHAVARSTNTPEQIDPEETLVAIPLKSKIPLEIEETDVVVGLDEKPEEEAPVVEEESEELGLDDAGMEEEIDPFNDKWEA